MSIILTAVLKYFIMTVASILIAIITFYVQKLGSALLLKIQTTASQEDLSYVQRILKEARQDIITAVDTVQQTYVSELKEKGEFTPEAQEKALIKAIEITKKELLNKEQIDIIQAEYPSLDGFIKTAIESYLNH